MDELLWEEFFEDIYLDFGEESQQDWGSADTISKKASEPCHSQHKRSRHLLNKKEREKLTNCLQQVDGPQLLDAVVKKLSEELHMQHYSEREELLISLLDSSSEEMQRVCSGLVDIFIEVYSRCDKGKEKYGRFQVEWHLRTSKFLVDEGGNACDTMTPSRLWLFLTKCVPTNVRNPLMIAITSAVYGFMLQQVIHFVKDVNLQRQQHIIETEPDEVYLRFGGGALAGMLQLRYKAMRSKKSASHKENTSKELQVLQWMRMTDRSELPAALAYRDRGGMYFPDKSLLPFIRHLDDCVCQNTNEESFHKYGKNLVKVVSDQVCQNQHLVEEFQSFIKAKVKEVQLPNQTVSSVYEEFSRKLCNTRLNEFLDTHRQALAAKKGKATITGQNLRDTLLSQHVNLKSQTK